MFHPTARRRVLSLLAAAGLTTTLTQPASAQEVGFGGAFPCTQDPVSVVYSFDTDDDGTYGIAARGVASGCSATLLGESQDTSYDTPDISDDGQRLAVSTEDGHVGPPGIAVTDGRGLRRLTFPTASPEAVEVDLEPSWSPDGSALLFTRATVDAQDQLTTQIMRVAAAGGEPTPVPGGKDGFSADWHPQGRLITFAVDSGDVPQVVVQDVDGAGRQSLAAGLDPAWSPDGRRIVHVSPAGSREDTTALSVVEVDTLRRYPLGGSYSTDAIASSPSWVRDGQSVVYTRATYDAAGELSTGDLWTVDVYGDRGGPLARSPQDELEAVAVGALPEDVSPGARSTYVPITPQRLLDTRTNPSPDRRVGHRASVRVPVRGVQTSHGTVPDDATAAVLNVTALNPTGSTDIRAYPSGTAVPNVSNLNVQRGQTVPNLVTVPLGTDGAVELRNNSGEVHLIADLAGWYAPGRQGAGFAPVDPSRILDTRGQTGGLPGPVGPGETIDLQVTGALRTADAIRTVTIPRSATAVVLNVTGTRPTASTDVRVYPTPSSPGPPPEISNLNLTRGQTAANAVIVAVGDGGRVRLRNQAGYTQLIVDIAGYYAPDAPAQFVPVRPSRFLDTRAAIGSSALPLREGDVLYTQLAGRRGVPAAATAAVMNLTATGVSASTDIRLYPATSSSHTPTVSNLNLPRGTTRANLAVVRLGDEGRIRARTSSGSTQLILDLAGYFVP